MSEHWECRRCGAGYPRPADMFCVFCQREGMQKTYRIALIKVKDKLNSYNTREANKK